jgi:hypothetical protein
MRGGVAPTLALTILSFTLTNGFRGDPLAGTQTVGPDTASVIERVNRGWWRVSAGGATRIVLAAAIDGESQTPNG